MSAKFAHKIFVDLIFQAAVESTTLSVGSTSDFKVRSLIIQIHKDYVQNSQFQKKITSFKNCVPILCLDYFLPFFFLSFFLYSFIYLFSFVFSFFFSFSFLSLFYKYQTFWLSKWCVPYKSLPILMSEQLSNIPLTSLTPTIGPFSFDSHTNAAGCFVAIYTGCSLNIVFF